MKKLCTIAAALLVLAGTSFGQTEKNSVLIGGALSINAAENSSQFAFNPTVGIFVADNLVIGGQAEYNSSKLGNVKSNEFGIGPFARYYIGDNNVKPFVVTEYGFLSSKTTSGNVEIKNNGTQFLFGLGFAAFVNETVAIEGLTGYSRTNYKGGSGSGGFALRLGFGLYFNNNTVTNVKNNF